MAKFTILEPMSTGDIIDRAVRLYRRNFTSLVAIVSVPTLIGYVSSLMFWYGYTNLFLPMDTAAAAPSDAVWMLALGGIGYPVWLFSLLVTVAGLSRVVGDHVMMGEPITFRKCFSTARKKLGDMIVMGLLSLAIMFGLYITLVIVIMLLIIIIGLVGGILVSAQLPQWALTIALSVTILIGAVVVLIFVSLVFARFVFLPQVVMIEGESAGTAIGRAVRLGKGNWYRVGSIALFTYFVSLSLMGALTLPVLAVLYMMGMIGPGFYTSSIWNVFYTSFKDVSSLLSLPIWIVSFTLLYFDSRVRKEAYDIELLAREVAPGFYWQPAPALQPAFAGFAPPRAFTQTGPLGLGGIVTRVQSAPIAAQAVPPVNENAPPPIAFDAGPPASSVSVAETVIEPDGNVAVPASVDSSVAVCSRCGSGLEDQARFCNFCGKPVEKDSNL
jgi:hypothetical protein